MTAPRQVASKAQGEATAVVGTAKDEAANVASTASGAAGDVAGTAKAEAGNVLGDTLTQAKNLTGQAKEQVTQQVDAGSQKLTGTLRDLSEQLDNGDTSGVVGQVLNEASQRMQGLADHLEQVGPEGLLEEVQGYARRNPGTFLLGMAVTGFAAGRLVKGLGAGKEQSPSALPAGSRGKAAGDPLAGVDDTGAGSGAAYSSSPYPESTYAPVEPLEPMPLASPTTAGAYGDDPLPGATRDRGAL